MVRAVALQSSKTALLLRPRFKSCLGHNIIKPFLGDYKKLHFFTIFPVHVWVSSHFYLLDWVLLGEVDCLLLILGACSRGLLFLLLLVALILIIVY